MVKRQVFRLEDGDVYPAALIHDASAISIEQKAIMESFRRKAEEFAAGNCCPSGISAIFFFFFLLVQLRIVREPVGIVQGAFFALVGLILAFGLTLAIGRYDARRTAVVDDANTIGTTYLRAQTLAEPMRSRSLQLLKQYTDASLALSNAVPTTGRLRTSRRPARRSPAPALVVGGERAQWRATG